MRIAAICGAPNYNTGMMFVDRALYFYLKEKQLLDKTTFFCFESNAVNKVGFDYKPLTKNVDLSKFDLVFIWGDFTISNHFLNMTKPKMAGKDVSLDYDLHKKVLMGELSDYDLKKVIVFGQCIYVDDRSIFENHTYVNYLKRLLDKSALVRLRDPLSAYRAKLISKVDKDFLGIDAALLNFSLDYKNIVELKKVEKNKNKTVGLFFARTKKMNTKKKVLGYYLKFKHSSSKFKWIPWLENKQQSKKYFPFAESTSPNLDLEYIKEIINCDLIITDTYHLTLMSWSLGVPCICFGNSAENFKLTVNDKKKEVFYASNFISDFYFYNENFYSDLKNNVLSNRMNSLLNTEIANKISDHILEISKENVKLLDKTINEILKLYK